MSNTQWPRRNVRDSMSEPDLITWSHVFASPHNSVYNLIFMYTGIVALPCLVFHPWTAAKPSVKADQLLTASMSWVIMLCTEVQISLVQFERPVGHHHCTQSSTMMIVSGRIWEVLAMVPDLRIGSASGLNRIRCHIGIPGCQHTPTVDLFTVWCKSPNLSDLPGLSVGCPVGSSVDSHNALAWAAW